MDADGSQDVVHGAVAEFQCLASQRGNLDSHCREIAERIIPSQKNLFSSWNNNHTQGEKRNQQLFDSTAATALTRFAAILDSLLTPRTSTWHKLLASDSTLNGDRKVRLWFEEVNRLLFKYRYAPRANFSAQNQANYKSLGAYGTGCVFIDQMAGGEPGVRYRNIHLGEIYFAENHQGIIDKAYRYYAMTARQATQKWGDKVSEKIRENKDREKIFYFLHCVKPRHDVDPARLDYKGMQYASYYISFDEKLLIEEGGYTSFPYATSRYEQCPGEIYGRSPAMDILPAVKTLNEQKKTMLKQGHRTVDPVLLVADDGIIDGFSMRPGALNSGGVSPDGRPLVHALPVGQLSAGKELMDDERSVINDAFLITLFQILVDTPQMTATEVLERTREKSFLLAPTIGRQQAEYLGPLIERELDVLARQKLLPPMPPLLVQARGEFRIEYDSPLSRSQRSEEAVGLMRVLEQAISVINITQDPSIIDFIDFDTAMPEVADIQGMPLRWSKSADAVAQIRDQRAKQKEQQMQIQAAPGAAALTNAVGKLGKGK